MRLAKYINMRKPVGEVSSISSNTVSVYLYPDAYEDVTMGDLVLVASRLNGYIGVVVKNLHRVRRERSFSLMGMDYEEVKRLYPDIDRLYIYAVEVAMVGYFPEGSSINVGLGGSPRLHDPVFKLDEEDAVNLFMDDAGVVSFDVFRYLSGYLGDDVWVREFFRRNSGLFRRLGDGEILLERIMDILVWLGVPATIFGRIVSTFVEEVLSSG